VSVVRFGAEVVQDPARAARLEWLLADGLGGYASSTVLGLNTRRYHGLLVAALEPPVGRMVLLSKLDEVLELRGRRIELATNAYPGGILQPAGFEHAVSFGLDPLPTLCWEGEDWRLTKVVSRAHGEAGTAVVYAYEGPAARLELRPLLAYRDHHALQHENDAVRGDVGRDGLDIVVAPYVGCPQLRLRVPRASWESDGLWYRAFDYAREMERGLDHLEDLWSPGRFSVALPGECLVPVLAWAGSIPVNSDAVAIVSAERRRLREARSGSEGVLGALKQAADAFPVPRGEGASVIAGYHWFEDWGRDSMISLPGLCLATGRFEEARRILAEYAKSVDQGMLPNRFPDRGGPPEFNSVDASLWFVVAVERFLEATGDRTFIRAHLEDAVFAILEAYRRGTRHDIHMTGEGLISQGEPGLQATWMDAKVGETVITPRRGLAIEIQALWYNALLLGAELLRERGDGSRSGEWSSLASRARDAAVRLFWSEERGYLADVVQGTTVDLSLRPNQLYAIGLPHALLPRDKAVRVLDAVRGQLLTPAGLRSLAPSDPGYRGRYTGGVLERDAAYHQGTVWPFLAGVYFEALIRVHGEDGKDEARDWLRAFAPHLDAAGLGYVSEVFDGDAPHHPGGTIAQAWSVAELLRIAARVAGRPSSPRARVPL
jgi:predicted glycogen debranching enzyme